MARPKKKADERPSTATSLGGSILCRPTFEGRSFPPTIHTKKKTYAAMRI
eukprot:CAMPEP_0113885948 /NCGR_PEP_ID=MMETSP0780_2-20120614/11240_1 /TAXON_ID=652834 /ORGANISM="Palpitomonas bilix" /LENGTH=49 /DNA_ID=CAMNT_0000874023 /DNA_START=1068 /DNA_END=1214 /DNA_ORIENTATION=- /assembly_acc=CAM_ASM_000599